MKAFMPVGGNKTDQSYGKLRDRLLPLEITTTIADGMSLRDYPDIKSDFLKEVYLFFFTGTLFIIMGRAGKLRKRFLAKITGRSLEEADRILYTRASWKSWKNQDECLIGENTERFIEEVEAVQRNSNHRPEESV